MLNIIELEKRWLHYKIKSFIPYITGLSVVVVLIVLGIIFGKTLFQVKTTKVSQKRPVQTTPTDTIKPKIVVEVKKSIPEKTIYLKPSLSFMKNIANASQPYYENDLKREIPKTIKKSKQKAPKTTKIEEVILPLKAKIDKKKKKIKIKIGRNNEQNDINEIIKRFQKNNNPALSLFVAKKQYELKNYNQAYNYALITNKLNNNIDESWIIFTKSLVKLGKKKQAISTLKKHIKYSHSSNAQILLNEILSGKFK